MYNTVIVGTYSAAIGMWALAAAISFTPLDVTNPGDEPAPMVSPDKDMLATYTECSKEAEVRLLSLSEATLCSGTYLLLKLSFLPDVEFEEFKLLAPIERWEIQQRGYAAFQAWKEGNAQRNTVGFP
jgi:hypothetical protein